ncbi:unnamed protein product [Moneuplotes crassus]|uniref:Uncharacterized protein n=1 Tax=Euplotes crassus TaxID=5936 RepID=A0AAD1XPP4_EUPCR|nr:unnamed protein product [Moneuplotes crassus]
MLTSEDILLKSLFSQQRIHEGKLAQYRRFRIEPRPERTHKWGQLPTERWVRGPTNGFSGSPGEYFREDYSEDNQK